MTSDAERHPLLTESGRRVLRELSEAPDAPRWNHRCGDRLDGPGRRSVESFSALIATEPPAWAPDRPPAWLASFLDGVRRVVPRYRAAGSIEPPFTTSRDDLDRAWWELVRDDVDVEDLIWFPTSGTGRRPVVVPTHPVAVSRYHPLLLEAARWHGVSVRFRDDRADWVTVVSQARGGFTVPSWSSFLRCGTAKVNLDPAGWRRAEDRTSFLARHDPQVITGDPVSLSALAELEVALHPAVLVSTAMALADATRARLEARFGCPVVDVYSITEVGPIAARRPGGGMGLLQPRLYVEVTDSDGWPVPPGAVGTVTVTGGMNPYLPLVRYGTGDTARFAWSGDQPVLEGLSGRPPVTLRTASGDSVPSFELTLALTDLPLRRWRVHQRADRSVVVFAEPEAGGPGDVATTISSVLGAVGVTVEPLTDADKVVPFTVEPEP